VEIFIFFLKFFSVLQPSQHPPQGLSCLRPLFGDLFSLVFALVGFFFLVNPLELHFFVSTDA